MDASKDMFYLLAGGLGFAITLTVSDILNLLDSAILTYLVYSVFFAYLGYLYALWSAPVSKRDDEGVEDEEEEKEVEAGSIQILQSLKIKVVELPFVELQNARVFEPVIYEFKGTLAQVMTAIERKFKVGVGGKQKLKDEDDIGVYYPLCDSFSIEDKRASTADPTVSFKKEILVMDISEMIPSAIKSFISSTKITLETKYEIHSSSNVVITYLENTSHDSILKFCEYGIYYEKKDNPNITIYESRIQCVGISWVGKNVVSNLSSDSKSLIKTHLLLVEKRLAQL
jgi:hypothetical protein